MADAMQDAGWMIETCYTLQERQGRRILADDDDLIEGIWCGNRTSTNDTELTWTLNDSRVPLTQSSILSNLALTTLL